MNKVGRVNIIHGFFLSFLCTWRFGDAGFGLAPHGPVQSDPFWHGLGLLCTSYVKLRPPIILKQQFEGKNLYLR